MDRDGCETLECEDGVAPLKRDDSSILRLGERDSDLFLAALEAEPRELPALRKASARRRERFGE